MIGVIAFGKICATTIRSGPAPSARSATTNSCSLIDSTLARESRAYCGMKVMVMPSRAFVSPGPKMVTIDIASSRAGKASTTSITRMMRLSARRPDNRW